MPAPSNTSFATATDLGTLPATISQNAHDAGITYPLIFKITAPVGVSVVGAFGFGGTAGSGYRPLFTVWDENEDPWPDGSQVNGQNKPFMFPVVAGQVFYLKFTPNAGNPTPAVLDLSVYRGPNDAVEVGSILVPNDVGGHPAAVIDKTTGEILRFIYPFPAGEAGDSILATGRILMADDFDVTNAFKLYSPTFELLATLPYDWSTASPEIRAQQTLGVWYIGDKGTGATVAKIKLVTADGAFGPTTWNLPVSGMTALAVNNDGTIAYFSGQGGAANSEIERWDLVNDVALSDLVVDFGGVYRVFDILVLANGELVVGYYETSGTPRDVKILHYSAAGATLHTYDLTDMWSSTGPHLFPSENNLTSFWFWGHPAGTGESSFKQIRVSDGVLLTDLSPLEFEGGVYSGVETDDPESLFGNTFSCPVFLLTNVDGDDDDGGGDLEQGVIGPLIWIRKPRRIP